MLRLSDLLVPLDSEFLRNCSKRSCCSRGSRWFQCHSGHSCLQRYCSKPGKPPDSTSS